MKHVVNSPSPRIHQEAPSTVKATIHSTIILYAVRMPLRLATKIQRAFRDWKRRLASGLMDGITASNNPGDMQAFFERDAERMVAIYERSRATKIALKKTIVEKNDRMVVET